MKNTAKPASILALLLLGLLVLPARASAPQGGSPQGGEGQRSALELAQRAETRLRYGAAGWTRGALRAGLATELVLPGWALVEFGAARGHLTRTWRRAADAQAPASFVLETRVSDALDEAHEQLVTWLAGVQSAERMPSAAEVGLELGDAAFVGRSGAAPAALAWIAFVRGNVAVRLTACDAPREPGLDLGALAVLVDQAIAAAPRLEAGSAPAKPAVAFGSTPRTALVAGASLRLDVSVTDPAGGEPHLAWNVGGSAQGYVERAADGAWVLHTTGPGPLALELEVTGSLGTWSSRTLELTVLDD
jgi:hypothetical protein